MRRLSRTIVLALPLYTGFLIKVKKILESICTNCGRLKVDSRDTELFSILNRVQPKYRLKYVWERAKSMNTCEEDFPDDNGIMPEFGHGGCGHKQPLIRKEGLKLKQVTKKIDEADKKVSHTQAG